MMLESLHTSLQQQQQLHGEFAHQPATAATTTWRVCTPACNSSNNYMESMHTSMQQHQQLHVKDSSEGVGVGVSKVASLGMQHLLHFH
jgi:hypothetical protein